MIIPNVAIQKILISVVLVQLSSIVSGIGKISKGNISKVANNKQSNIITNGRILKGENTINWGTRT